MDYDGENLEVSQWPLGIETFMNEKSVKFLLWKDKLRHIKYVTSLFEQSLIWMEQSQTGSSSDDSMDRTSWKDFYREDGEAQRQPYLIDYHVSGCLIWKDLVGGLWLVVLGFWFVDLEAFQA